MHRTALSLSWTLLRRVSRAGGGSAGASGTTRTTPRLPAPEPRSERAGQIPVKVYGTVTLSPFSPPPHIAQGSRPDAGAPDLLSKTAILVGHSALGVVRPPIEANALRLLQAIRGKRLGRLEHRAPRVACGTLALEEFEHEVLCFPPSRSLDGSEL